MPGARCTRGLVRKIAQRNAHTSIQVQRRQSGIPCARVLRLMLRSPRRRIRLVTVAAGLTAGRSGWIDFATDSLTPATGVGTTQFCRTLQRRSSCTLVLAHDKRPANTHHAPDAAASTTSHPASVTIMIRPLCRERTGELVELICPTRKAKYFCEGDWTTQIRLNPFRKLHFARTAFRCDCAGGDRTGHPVWPQRASR